MTESHANQGHCYANQVVTELHAKSRAFMQFGQIHTEIRVQACMALLRKGRKKEYSKKTDKDKDKENPG